MKKAFKYLSIIIFLLFISYIIPILIENNVKIKEPLLFNEISRKILDKGLKEKINLQEAERYYFRAKKQMSIQKAKMFFLRDYSYSELLFQKSIELAINEIGNLKAKKFKEKEIFLSKLDETKKLNAQIFEIFYKIPLGSNFFKNLLFSTLHLKEAENYYKIGNVELAKEKLELSSVETKALFSGITDSLKNFYNSKKIMEWKSLYREAVRTSFNLNVIVVIKDERILKLLKNGEVIKTYSVEFGKNPLEKKIKSGDLATPEGRYKIIEKKGRNQTKYYLALLLNYPNEDDKKRFEEHKRKGLIPKNAKIGGLIEIHGDGGQGIDWTEGCVALSNEDMKDLFNKVSKGTPVYIIGSLGNNNVLSNLENQKLWEDSKKS